MFSMFQSLPLVTYAKVGGVIILLAIYTTLWFRMDYYKAKDEELSQKVQQLKGEIKRLKFESQNQSDAAGANHEIESNRTIVIRPGSYEL